MGQLFFDITSLANFFIHKNDKSNKTDVKDRSDCSFEDWLSFSVINDKAVHHSQRKLEADFKFSFLDDVPAVGIGNGSVNRLDNPLGDDLSPFEQISNQNPTNLPAETYSLKTMSAVEIRDLIRSQTIPVTLDLQKSKWFVDLSTIAFSDDNAGQEPEAYLNTQYGQAADNTKLTITAYDEHNKGISSSFDYFSLQKETSRFSKLTFTVDKLFGQENQFVPVKIIAEGNNVFDYEISVGKLRELVKNYPDRILIEVKTVGIDNNSIVDNKSSSQSASSLARIDQINKYIIFDLKTLLIQKDSESRSDIQKINVIEKIVITKVQITKGQVGLENLIEKNASDDQAVIFKNHQKEKIQKTNRTSVERLITQTSQKTEKLINTAIDVTRGISERTWYKETVEDVISRHYPGIKLNETSDFASEKLPVEDGASARVVENIDKIISQLRSRLMVISGNTRMTIRLKPESLGRITISLSYDGNKIEALFRVENPEVKQILEAEMSRLKAELNIDNCKVETALREFDRDFEPSYNRHHHSKMTGVPPYHYLSSIDEDDSEEDNGNIRYSGRYHCGRIDLLV